MTDPKFPTKRGASEPAKKTSKALELLRASTAAKKTASNAVADRTSLRAAALAPRRPKMVFSIDATASRQGAWESAKKVTDSLFSAIPGELDIALAVHSGSGVSMFTAFSNDVGVFRDAAARVTCVGGTTKLVDLMRRTSQHSGVKVFLYIGDNFEEDAGSAYEEADAFKAHGVRAVMLHDATSGRPSDRAVFEEIARRTGGVCLDFYGGDRQAMKDIFEAVAVLAAGGVHLLEARKAQLPGAAKLLPRLK